jgi:periplasmic divalent cation tolerance protein
LLVAPIEDTIVGERRIVAGVRETGGERMGDFIVVFVTTSGRKEAERIAMQLINSGSAPCVNIISPCFSVYQWKGSVHHDEEALMIIKSARGEFENICNMVSKVHSYDVPEIISFSLDGISTAYRGYLDGFFRQ